MYVNIDLKSIYYCFQCDHGFSGRNLESYFEEVELFQVIGMFLSIVNLGKKLKYLLYKTPQ